ncbi:ribbon-helix-helix domain-containing protein [Cellulomonas sp. HD19AZ1]|uniref:ribbon-helix-helix domain-containing protein n=1 Tax=Cellulomonas sp. HD19AZ1 TaxID=2559593 RepID=UPI001070797C|nr:ribbon-helix-helix domain-containing protein [Cellulomonas sp. HD19AZ1]TFH68136.1 CopG family transcriptional regulator [Cellulomonas sp. HD19AZ1]
MTDTKRPTAHADDAHFDELSRRVESADFALPRGAKVRSGGPGAGRDFLAQYMSPDELDAATRRGRGRPSLSGAGKSPSRQTRLPHDLDDLLVERANREGRSISDVLRAAVEDYLRPTG